VSDLAAIAQDVKWVLAFDHLLHEVRHHVTHRQLYVATHHVVVAQRASLADADAVERAHDGVRKQVLLVRAVRKKLHGKLLKSICGSGRRVG
jgi:hypothetical protein